MIKSFPLPEKQIKLLVSAQNHLNAAQQTMTAIAGTVLAGLDVPDDATVHSVDTDLNTLSVEVPE